MTTSCISRLYRLFIFFIILISCNNGIRDKNVSAYKADSSENFLKKDSSNIVKLATTNAMNSYVEDYEKMYRKHETIDSVFMFKGDTMQLFLNHYCTFDQSIRLPSRYIVIFGLDSFVTHSFQSDLVLKKNGVKILGREIRKKDFNQFLDTSLIKYGVLLYPEVRVYESEIQIGYSVSSPYGCWYRR